MAYKFSLLLFSNKSFKSETRQNERVESVLDKILNFESQELELNWMSKDKRGTSLFIGFLKTVY